jgi:uncharacterized protein (UPF0335 family)
MYIKIISKPIVRYRKRDKEELKEEVRVIKRYQMKAIKQGRKNNDSSKD